MRITRFHVIATAVCLAAAGCTWIGADDEPKASLVVREGAKTRDVTFTYVARLKEVPKDAKRLDLWLPVPQSSPAQQVKAVRFSGADAPELHAEPAFGNRIAHFRFEGAKLKPFEVTEECDVLVVERLHERSGSMFRDEPQPRDLQGDRLAPVGGETAALAAEATKDAAEPLDAAEKIYRRVLEKMRYSKDGTGWGQGDTSFACKAGYGNCTDFHAMFMSMARAKGIPARFTMGFPLPDARGDGEVKGYHCWAEFHVKDVGWIPVDASEADKALDANQPELADYYFGNLTENRIAFSRGRDFDLVPKQQGGALNFFIYPYAEVDGKPFAGVERSFHYRDH